MEVCRPQFRILEAILGALGGHLEAVLGVLGAILVGSLGMWRLLNVKIVGIMGRCSSYRILRGFWEVLEAILEV